jgi:hypothetical protein
LQIILSLSAHIARRTTGMPMYSASEIESQEMVDRWWSLRPVQSFTILYSYWSFILLPKTAVCLGVANTCKYEMLHPEGSKTSGLHQGSHATMLVLLQYFRAAALDIYI